MTIDQARTHFERPEIFGWRSYPSWELLGDDTMTGRPLAVPVSDSDHRLGRDDALVTIVFYGDYTNVASRDTYAELKQIESLGGERLAVVYRHLPHLSADRPSVRLAEAAEAAGAQGHFWAAHDRLYRDLQASVDDLDDAASDIGLDLARFHDALAARCFLPVVLAHCGETTGGDTLQAPCLFVNGIGVAADVDIRLLWAVVEEEIREADAARRSSEMKNFVTILSGRGSSPRAYRTVRTNRRAKPSSHVDKASSFTATKPTRR